MMDTMRYYRQLRLLIFFVIASYFLIAAGGVLFMGISEIFPIFSWDLFSGVPPIYTYDYGLKVSKLNDETFDPPVYIDQIEHLIPGSRSDYNLSHPPSLARYVKVQQLGNAIISNNVEEIARQRLQIEVGKVDQEAILVVFEKGDKR